MPVHEPDIAEANRLYWETDDSVASIANRLDVSRRALYEAVQPISCGATCDSCGGDLAFENRSARKHGVAVCPVCGADAEAGAIAAAGAPASRRPAGPGPVLDVVRGDQRIDAILDLRDPGLRHRAVVLGSVAIAGVAVGTMAAIFAMRRDE